MCLRLKSISSLASAIRKMSDSFRFLVVKSRGQALSGTFERASFSVYVQEKRYGVCSSTAQLGGLFFFSHLLQRISGVP